MHNYTKFIQIACNNTHLFTLDENGDVWECEKGCNCWHKLDMTRKE